ncbi:MAG TPA: DUF5977 domain-containing protein [Flavisolibacter sp.]|nr:DUF5977 domain-containing protein [Flavisolibacter sp.]
MRDRTSLLHLLVLLHFVNRKKGLANHHPYITSLSKKLSGFVFAIFTGTAVVAQVNLQTGAAQASIPLYSYSDPANRISTSVALNYTDGNGLKVSEVASSVGTGWELLAGGAITRIQRGEPDDQKENIPNNTNYSDPLYRTTYYPNGYLYATVSPSDPVRNGACWSPLAGPLNYEFKPPKEFLSDREQDLFRFSFNGRSGEFVIGRNGAVKTIQDSKLKIDYAHTVSSGVRTTISSFTLTDEQGIKYIFRDAELTEAIKYDQVKYNGVAVLKSFEAIQAGSCTDFNTCQSMLLGRALGEFVINKWCLSEIVNPLTNARITFDYESYDLDYAGEVSHSKILSGSTLAYSMSSERIKGRAKRLKRILCSAVEQVELVYQAADRIDLPGDKGLAAINIIYNGRIKYSWQLELGYLGYLGTTPYSYNAPVNSIEAAYYRLYLLSLHRAGGGQNELPYQFSYYTATPNTAETMPGRFSYFRDHWGYSNATAPVWGGILSPAPDEYDRLMSVFYRWDIYNNLGQFRGVQTGLAKLGILRSVTYPAGGRLDFDYEQNTALDENNVSVLVGGVRVSKTTAFDGIDPAHNRSVTYNYTLANGSSSGWGYEPLRYSGTYNARLHKCGNYLYAASQIATETRTVIGAVKNWKSLGVDTKALIVLQIVAKLYNLFSSGTNDFSVTEFTSTALNAGNLLPLQYARVEVQERQNSVENGKTVYEFTAGSRPYPDYGFPYAGKQRQAPWAYGLPAHIEVRDKNGNLKKEVVNSYNVINSTVSDPNFLSQKWGLLFREYDCAANNGELNDGNTNYIASDFYYPLTGHAELRQSVETNYNETGQGQTVTVNFQYSPLNYEVASVTTTNAKGELLETRTCYPLDYTPGGSFIQALQDNNRVNVPIGSFSYITKGGIKYLLGGEVTEFATINGDSRPVYAYAFRSRSPVAAATLPVTPSWLPSAAYFKAVQAIQYNSSGLPSEVTSDQGRVSTIYDYNNLLPVATVENADLGDVAYTSFEADGKGSWVFSGSSLENGSVPTGRKYYDLATGAISRPVDPNKTYICSYWTKTGAAITVSGRQATATSGPFRGWNYVENTVSGISSLILSGTGPIDELRLYPKGTIMSTATYDPLFGKTSEADEKNNITTYGYDGLGRLYVVRDQNGSILKRFCYTPMGQSENCAVFGNQELYGTFTRNCGPDYIGGSVPYKMEAGRYFASSQAEANALAQATLTTEGQANANTYGSCTLIPRIYARIETENVISFGYGLSGDAVVHFYSDAACTQPVYVSGLLLNWATNYIAYDCNRPNEDYYFTYQTVVSGYAYTLAYNQELFYDDGCINHFNDFRTVSGTGYIPVR